MNEHKLPPIDYTRFRLSLKRLEENMPTTTTRKSVGRRLMKKGLPSP